jgi:soluble P-type ATPase
VKNYDPTSVTLSIGDGGNDVPMITQAHIGNLHIKARNRITWRRRS